MKHALLLLALLVLLPGFSYPPAEPGVGYRLDVLEMGETGVVLELHLTDYTLIEREHEGVTYAVLTVPGLVSLTGPGQPGLPGLGTLLATAPGGIERIEVLEVETETLEGVRLFPTPGLALPEPDAPPVETVAPDAALYSRDALFPDAPAEVGLSGWLRDQPVAQVRLVPFQYNPARGTLEIYRRLRVQVHFSPTPGTQAEAPPARTDTPYERMLESALLNYAARPPVSQPPPAVQPADISAQDLDPALKVFVEEDGLYQVTYQDIQNAGLNLDGIDPRHLHLLNLGSEVAIHIHGEEDGVFDPGDWLEFYGLAASSEYTSRNVYWLTPGDGPGLRMPERDGTPTGAGPTPTSFYTTLYVEENHEYWKDLPNGEGQDHWFWERFPSAPHTSYFSFNLGRLAPIQADALVRVSLHGRTSTALDPDHHTRILLNDALIDEAWWDGQMPFTHQVTVPQQLFREGYNQLTVRTPGDTGSSVDSLYFNSFEIGYWDTYVAENDRLHFAAPGAGTYTFVISNFSQDAIEVYDISQPSRVVRLVNASVEAEGGTYRVRVEDDVSSDARYLALTEGQKRTPAGFLLDAPSNWRSPENGADYVIITHEDFTDAAIRLADYRAGQGLRVATVQINDVYDEFSGGVFDPGAIRDFLSYAYHNWTPPAPLYVLLVGDANYDYQDYLDTGNPNYVPTHLFESWLIGQTPTDNWFVSVSGDDPLPDMFIGRISVWTLAQADIVVDKILAYEQNPPPGDWKQSALFVADDEAGFEETSDELIARLPAWYNIQRIYATGYPPSHDPTPDIIRAIDDGTLIVNYLGHGYITYWSSWPGGNIFQRDDIANLHNGPLYPLLVTGNCYNGLFAHPTTRSAFAEEFVNVEGRGGIAAWSPTGLGYTSWHETLSRELYATIFEEYTYQLGPATTAAKLKTFAQLGWRDPIEIFTLFGDPALTLQAVQPRLTLEKAANVANVQAGQLLTYTLTYANHGNQPAENAVLTETYDPHTQFVSASPAPSNGDNVWQLGALPPGASGTISVTLRVLADVPIGTTLRNQALLSSDSLDDESAAVDTSVASQTYLPFIMK